MTVNESDHQRLLAVCRQWQVMYAREHAEVLRLRELLRLLESPGTAQTAPGAIEDL